MNLLDEFRKFFGLERVVEPLAPAPETVEREVKPSPPEKQEEPTAPRVEVEEPAVPEPKSPNKNEQGAFKTVPAYGRERIFGTEQEFGVEKVSRYPGWLPNGGKIYKDCGHLEYASPEASNPLSAVIFSKAGELISLPHARKLYKNNVAANGETFGSHENYFTKASFLTLEGIIPFLATRQIFAGSGQLHPDGEFSIAQRSAYIENATNNTTRRGRALLCTKNESLSGVEGWHRLHLILGDANMSEVAEFLKLGTTGLVLDLAEDEKLPLFNYSNESIVNDTQNIARQTEKWQTHMKLSAVDVQRQYLDATAQAYEGRDEITDELLTRWERTLTALDDDPMQLVGTLDWVTKKAFIDAYAGKNNLSNNDFKLRNIDLQYHDVNPKKSLFYQLQKAGRIERLVTDELIEDATENPPSDTRAYARGTIVGSRKKNIGPEDWERISQSEYCYNCEEMHFSRALFDMPDPFNTYAKEMKEILETR